MEFLAVGTAPAYRAEGPSGRFFVKVVPSTEYGAAMLRRVTAEVPLLRALRQHDILQRVPRVIPINDSADLKKFGDYFLLVYEWLNATNVESDWTNTLPDLAALLGRLHAASHIITEAVPEFPVPPEDFGLPFEPQWLDNWQHLRSLRPNARPGVRALYDLLMPYADDLERLLEAARSFQQAARARETAFVVCHTDAHGGNVMRGAAGELWIIDWETARLAPPEHDLWMLHARLPAVLSTYEAAFGRSVSLDLDLLGFYFYRRVLEDLAMDVNMILNENTRDEEDKANLDVLERFILPAAAQVEEEFARLSRALECRGDTDGAEFILSYVGRGKRAR